ncbi:MAG TPA: 50S ribosomal protein L25/general stress protein Ctc [Mycobacteriales bacterium]|nr:50S ribosomal protein L25/general stress protein Ctc [Mycobacteriales bacterium]
MSEVRIVAEARTEFGKGGARRTRRAGKVPAVLYGHGGAPRHLALPAREFAHALRTDAGLNVLLNLEIDGGVELALPKSVQRDPLRGDIEHVDLLLVRRGETVRVEVAVHIVGAVLPGGLLDHQVQSLSVEADAVHIPDHLEVDVSDLAVGGSVHAGDVSLPPGTVLAGDPSQVVAHMLAAPTAEQVEAELAGAEAEVSGVTPSVEPVVPEGGPADA